jgi:tRNA pseudouridine38-40 synthase
MPTYRLTVSYLGTPFAGWQVQRGKDTVQGRLQAALRTVLGEETAVIGAGRTDAGVHARAQVAHVRTPQSCPASRLRVALNSLLPQEIRLEKVTRSRDSFHARHDAAGKHYRYLLHVGRKPSPFEAGLVGRVTGPPPDLESMRRAASYLVGEHDFSAFCGAGTAIRDRRRRVTRLDLWRRGDTIGFEVEGNGFLRHQVRNMVGTLVEVGQGRRAPGSMRRLLASRDRRQAGATAPAAGLCLMQVRYRRAPRVTRR